MALSRFDHAFRNLLLTKMFVKGWGKPDHLKRLLKFRRKTLAYREEAFNLVSKDHPVQIQKEYVEDDMRVLQGSFRSPWADVNPGIMPPEAEMAKFQMILPKNWNSHLKPVCINLAGTGDHSYFLRKQLMATPLLKNNGVASIMLENPFYGERKPPGQFRSSLNNVSDLFVMGGAIMLETVVLLHWCEQQGWGPFCLFGVSMGGFTASLAATIWTKPIALVPCLSWSTATDVYTKGVLSSAIPWKVLKSNYNDNRVYQDEIRKLLCSLEKSRSYISKEVIVENSNLGDNDSIVNRIHSGISAERKQVTRRNEFNDILGSEIDPTTIDSQKNLLNTFYDRVSSTVFSPTGLGSLLRKQRRVDDWKAKSFSNKKQAEGKVPKLVQTLDFETKEFMSELMDEFTHLANYSVPVDPNLIISVVAKLDSYVPRENVLCLQKLWPGSDIRYLPDGHIISIVKGQNYFRQAVLDALDRNIQKYYT